MTQVGRQWLPPAILMASVIVIWEMGVRAFGIAPYLLPAPSAIWTALGEVKDLLPSNVATTLTEAALGLLVGALVGASVAALLHMSPMMRRALQPLLVVSQTIPMVILAPLLVLWFGLGLLPKVLVVALTTFFPVAIATLQGLASVDNELIDLLRSMGANKRQITRLILLPSSAVAFFAGLRIAASYSVASAVIAEWVGASSGLGLLVTRAHSSFRIDRSFVAVGAIAALSLALFGVVELIARLVLPWHRPNSSSRLKGIT